MSFLRYLPVVAAFVVAEAVVLACSNSGSSEGAPPSCLSDPTSCSSGETCWPLDETHFGCIASLGTGTFGQSCQNTFGAATCTDGFACDQTTPTNGVCMPYCGTTTKCPGGYTCSPVAAGDAGATISVCRTTPSTTTIGTQGGGGADGDGGAVMLYPDGSNTGRDEDGGTPIVAQ